MNDQEREDCYLLRNFFYIFIVIFVTIRCIKVTYGRRKIIFVSFMESLFICLKFKNIL